jgi:prepilin-type N-terminal cleavage/methylation domain-containing protein
MSKAAKRQGGFTLIELLAVIAIVLVLMSLLVPMLGRLRRIAVRTVDLSNMRQFVSACAIYTSDNESLLPISTREGVANCGHCDDMAWFRFATYTNLQRYVNDPDKKIFACNNMYKNADYMKYIGVSRDCWGTYVSNLPPDKVNGTHIGWNFYAGREVANCNWGVQPAYDPQGNQITNDYRFPTRLGEKATSRTLATCPDWISGSGAWNGVLVHLDPDDGIRTAPIGYPVWGVPDFAGLNIGYVDGAARWVKNGDLGVFKDVNWMYFDRTR